MTSWSGSVQGPYPIGNPSAQPDLLFAFPSPKTGARDQSCRLIVRPDLWARQMRLRFSNSLGTRPVTFDDIHVGLQRTAAALVVGSNQPVTFAGESATAVGPGSSVWSDPVILPFVHDPATAELLGPKLAVSFHVVGESGPITWHAKALTTSYLTAPGAGAKGESEDEYAFPFGTASWYFLDALDMMVPADARGIVAFGDSISDGTASTMNGDDRGPDVLARRFARSTATDRGGERRHRRQPGGGACRLFGAEALFRRAVGQRPARPRCAVAIPHRRRGLARRHQRFRQERQCLGR